MLNERKQKMLLGDIFVLHLLCKLLGRGERRVKLARQVEPARRTLDSRKSSERDIDRAAGHLGRKSRRAQKLAGKSLALREQGGEQMQLFEPLMMLAHRKAFGGAERLHAFFRKFLKVRHSETSLQVL